MFNIVRCHSKKALLSESKLQCKKSHSLDVVWWWKTSPIKISSSWYYSSSHFFFFDFKYSYWFCVIIFTKPNLEYVMMSQSFESSIKDQWTESIRKCVISNIHNHNQVLLKKAFFSKKEIKFLIYNRF